MKYEYGFIGCGNMGGALVGAVAKTLPPEKIAVCDHNAAKTETLKKTYGVIVATAEEIASHSRFIVLGVKPQAMEKTLAQISAILKNRKNVTLVSMAAGLSANAISAMAGGEYPVIRMMPNTPCKIGKGVILFTALRASEVDKQAFCEAFSAAGLLDELAEEKIDGAGALSGCGPAFAYIFADALADGAVECGIPRDKATLYAAQTLLGAAAMILDGGKPSKLKEDVCSPGGTTIAGVHALEERGLRAAAMDAVVASYQRTLQLKK